MCFKKVWYQDVFVYLLVLKPLALIPSNQFKNRDTHSHPSCIFHEAIGRKPTARLICKLEMVTLALGLLGRLKR